MKRTVCEYVAFFIGGLIIHAALAPAQAVAALENFDPFAYSGTALNSQSGGTGWIGAWSLTASTDNTLSNDGVSLAYPASFEAPFTTPTTSGSRVSTGIGLDANNTRLLAQTIPLNVDGTVRYASALFRKNRPNGDVLTDNILLEFRDSSGNRRWGFGIEGTGDKPWLNANASTSPTTPVTVGDTYFMVTKIVSSATGLDQAFLKVYGTGYSNQVTVAEPTSWDATLTETTAAVLDRVRLRIDSGNTGAAPGEVDDIRIATTWAEVVGQVVPAGISGDYNHDGKVDAADYVIWRKDPATNGGDPAGYDTWRANFGNPPGSGARLSAANVPEPAGLLLVPFVAAALLVSWRPARFASLR